MALIGKIQTLFSDREKTTPVFPRTKVSAVSDENGVGLNIILSDMSADIENVQNVANNAIVTADAAMPKSGGEFTDDVVAYSINRDTACLRNGEVRISSTTGELQFTNKIIYVRK